MTEYSLERFWVLRSLQLQYRLRVRLLLAAAQETKASEGEVKAEEAPAAETPVQ